MISLDLYCGKKIAILGLGRSGMASARALKAGGAELIVWDDQKPARENAKQEGFALVDFSKETHLETIEYLILSPGIIHQGEKKHPIVALAQKKSIPVMGDLELFAHYLNHQIPKENRPKLVVITGSNGKSTTTALISHILKSSNRHVQMGGNIGIPVLELEMIGSEGVYVIEASSYQLSLTQTLKPDLAVWLNIASDHIEYHGSLEAYILAKENLFLSQEKGDHIIIGVDDPASQRICTELFSKSKAKIIPISSRRALASGVHITGGILWDAMAAEARQILNVQTEIDTLKGRHNAQNLAASYAVCQILKLSKKRITDSLSSFKNLPHRMEIVGNFLNILYINDSKATNIAATIQALKAYRTVYWIAGGQPKKENYETLKTELNHVQRIYLIGEASASMKSAYETVKPVKEVKTLDRAVAMATYDALKEKYKNPVILFSPACASFDQYKNFEERGNNFKHIITQVQHACSVSEHKKNSRQKNKKQQKIHSSSIDPDGAKKESNLSDRADHGEKPYDFRASAI